MRHGEGKELAQRLYIYDQMTFEEIARHIGRSDKTVRTWAADGDWQSKREKLLARHESTAEKLHKVVDHLADSIIRDCEQGETPDPGRTYALARLADKLDKLRKYETTVNAEQEENKPGADGKDITQRVEEILGLR